MDITRVRAVHCVGIGGIGVSAIAKFFKSLGADVTGSDAVQTNITDECSALGIPIAIGHRSENIPEACDCVVYSPAVPEDNPERARARSRGIAELSYPEVLGEISRTRPTIAVSGTHGKSTTTAMLGRIFERAGRDPLVIVGSKVPGWELGNIRLSIHEKGAGKIPTHKLAPTPFIVEACEYREHMRELSPETIVVTNIEHDHPDYFRDLDHTTAVFSAYVRSLPLTGLLVVNAQDSASEALTTDARTVRFGIECEGEYVARDMRMHGGCAEFTVCRGAPNEEELGRIRLRVPGRFNVANAMGALAAALEWGVQFVRAKEALEEFTGLWRRFEVLGRLAKDEIRSTKYAADDRTRTGADTPIIVSDYGHHPTAIQKTLETAREAYPNRRVVLVYQPHQHERTHGLKNEFIAALADADRTLITDIYDVAGRDIAGAVHSSDLVGAPHVHYTGSLEDTKKALLECLEDGDVCIVMGAGNIDALARSLPVEH